MRTFTIGEILKATGGTLCCGSEQSHVLEIATDSRKAKAGDIFFALKGEVTDDLDHGAIHPLRRFVAERKGEAAPK